MLTFFLHEYCNFLQEISANYRLKPNFFVDSASMFDVKQGELGK